jgi:hypothetical protein
MLLKIADPVNWALNSGYEINPIDNEWRDGAFLGHSEFPSYQAALEHAAQTLYSKPFAIEATDVSLLVFNSEGEDVHNYKYFLISKNSEIFTDDQVNHHLWLKFFGFFNNVTNNEVVLNQKFVQTVSEINNSDSLVFVGGQSHFGHWLTDHLPLILLCEKAKYFSEKNFSYLGPKLNDFQVESLSFCGISHDFQQHSIGQYKLAVLKIKKLTLVTNLSIFQRYALLREKFYFQETHSSSTISKTSLVSKKIYFKRGVVRGKQRIKNEAELINLLKEFNFDVITPHEFNLREKQKLLSQYDLFVCPPASAYFNFYLFSKPSAHMIFLCNETALYNKDVAVYGHSIYQVPDLYRTTVISTSQPSAINILETNFDLECVVDLALVEKSLRELKY